MANHNNSEASSLGPMNKSTSREIIIIIAILAKKR